MTILDILKLGPVMPVIVIDSADQAEPLADALLAGGILTAEITLRTPAAIKAIEKMVWSALGQHHLFLKVAKAPDCRFCQGRQAYPK